VALATTYDVDDVAMSTIKERLHRVQAYTHLGGLPTTSSCATASSSRAITRQVLASPIVASGLPTS
jgi:hypothetical protein